MKKYDKVISIAPIQFTENGVGLAIGFEKAIDKEGIIAYNLPLVLTYDLSNNNNYGDKHIDPMFYFMPGLKFYPTGSHGKVKYALGPSLVVATGQNTDESYYGYGTPRKVVLLGVMINNSMNINVTRNVYMGMELGFGFTYIRWYGGINQGMGGLAQGGFKIGYRF
jgi:hypothetical protein